MASVSTKLKHIKVFLVVEKDSIFDIQLETKSKFIKKSTTKVVKSHSKVFCTLRLATGEIVTLTAIVARKQLKHIQVMCSSLNGKPKVMSFSYEGMDLVEMSSYLNRYLNNYLTEVANIAIAEHKKANK